MNYLLDTNVFLWAICEPKRLSKKMNSVLMTPEASLFISVASLWEMAIKASLNRLKISTKEMKIGIEDLGATVLNISLEDLESLLKLPPVHKDPFDRMLIAQAIGAKMIVLSGDAVFRKYEKLKVIG